MLIYSGDHDMCVPHTGSEAWTRGLGLKVREAWRPWKVHHQVKTFAALLPSVCLLGCPLAASWDCSVIAAFWPPPGVLQLSDTGDCLPGVHSHEPDLPGMDLLVTALVFRIIHNVTGSSPAVCFA